MDKILTVVIPTYNMEKYLHRCLGSLIVNDKEMLEKLEVLVVNDGSKDSSSAIAHNYQEKYPNVFRVIDKENGNYGSCINCGLKEGTGKYVKILDADDYFSNNALLLFLKKLLQLDVDLIITNFLLTSEPDKVVANSVCDLEANKLLSFQDIYSSNYMLHIEMHAITYLRENLLRIKYIQSEGISYTDQEWSFCPMVEVNSVYYYPVCLYQYFVGRPGQTIDPKIFYNSISQNFEVLKSTTEYYYRERERMSLEHNIYLYKRLCNRIDQLYRKFFQDWPQLDNVISEFKNFDIYLRKNHKQLYNDAGLYCLLDERIPFHYLVEWRNNGRSLMLRFMFFLYELLVEYRKLRINIKRK